MPESTCPTTDDLTQMIHGALADAPLEMLLSHIDGCPSCQARIEQIPTQDPLALELAELRGHELTSSGISAPGSSTGTTKIAKEIELPAEIGPYRLLRTIAIGGMGTVYEARHRRLGRPFAFKLLHSGARMSRAQAEQVRREWRTHGRLVHPNIVGATDAGIADGQPYLVTERIDGVDLSALNRQIGPFRPVDACEIIRQAAEGLQYAHDQQVIHGDVKPSNLMLDRRGVIKLLDLGTAKRLDSAVIRSSGSGTTHGTLAYMAPEQLNRSSSEVDRSPSTDHRADVYSLGCTLYCLLSGQPPFADAAKRSNQELIEAHRSEHPRRLQDVVATETNIDGRLQQLVDKMLAKDPLSRFQSMREVVVQIQPLCTGERVDELLSGLVLDSEHDADPSLSILDLTQGFTRLLMPSDKKRRWIWPVLASAIAIGLASLFVSARNRGISDQVVGDIVVATPDESGTSQDYTAKTSLGEDLWHLRGPVWPASARQGTLDGIVMQPAQFKGIANWQIETIAPRGRVRCVSWSHDGTRIATTSTDGHLRVFDWRNNRLSLTQIITHREHRFVSVVFHQSESILFAATEEKLMRIDSIAGTIQQEIDITAVLDVQWVNGHNLVSVSTSAGIRLFDPQSLKLKTKLDVNCQISSWSQTGDRVAVSANNEVSIWSLANGSFSGKPLGSRVLDAVPTDVEFTPSANQLAVVYPNRIEMFAGRGFQTTFSIVASSRLESISFGRTSEEMVIGSNEGVLQVKSSRLSGDAYRHQRWSLSKVAWNPHHDCIAVGQDGLLRIVDANLHPLDHVGGVKMVEDVTMHSPNCYGFLFRSGKTVCTDGAGTMLGWSTFLPDGNQVADSFTDSATLGMIGVRVSPSESGLVDVPICAPVSSAANLNHDGNVSAARIRWVRHHDLNEKHWVEVWNADSGQWVTTIKTNGQIKCTSLSPSGQRLATLSGNRHLTIAEVPSGKQIVNRTFDEVSLQNTIVWIDEGTLLVAGASDMTSRMMASYDLATDELNWFAHESHDCTAAEVTLLGKDAFLQAGAVFNIRSSVDGKVQRSIPVRRESGRRHGRVYHAPNSDRLFSWGYDYASSYASNASDGVVCWDADGLTPMWSLIDVGEEETVTMAPSGQIISSTRNATAELVWIVQCDQRIELKSREEFTRSAGLQ